MSIKVLNLTSAPAGFGGVERLLLDSAGKFDRDRFDIRYCNLFGREGGNEEFTAALRAKQVAYFHIEGHRWRDLPRVLAKLVRVLREERFDILNTHMLHAHIVGAVAARLARVPVRLVTRQYGNEGYANHGGIVRRLDYAAARTADHVVTVSEALREVIVSEVGLHPEGITIIPNAIDLGSFDASLSAAPAPPEANGGRPWTLGTLGSLTARKGHADLLRAFAKVLEVRPEVQLVIAGEGPERRSLESLARELGIADHVRMPGFQRNVAEALMSFDLYIHPSRSEAFGVSLVEAMAARRGIVATAVDGIPEVVLDGSTGILVPRSDPDRLAEAILKLMEHPSLAESMGERGRKRVETHFTIARVVEQYESLYSSLMRDHRFSAAQTLHPRE